MCKCNDCSRSPNAQGSINYCGGCNNFDKYDKADGEVEEKSTIDKGIDTLKSFLDSDTGKKVQSTANNPDVKKFVTGIVKGKKSSTSGSPSYSPSYSSKTPTKSNTLMYVGIAVVVIIVAFVVYKMVKKK